MDPNQEYKTPESEAEKDLLRPTRHIQESTNQHSVIPRLLIFLPAPILILAVLCLWPTDISSQITMVFDEARSPYIYDRFTPKHKIKYFVNPRDVEPYSSLKLSQLDEIAEANFLRFWDSKCDYENAVQLRRMKSAQGWFFDDDERMAEAIAYPKPSCERLAFLGYKR